MHSCYEGCMAKVDTTSSIQAHSTCFSFSFCTHQYVNKQSSFYDNLNNSKRKNSDNASGIDGNDSAKSQKKKKQNNSCIKFQIKKPNDYDSRINRLIQRRTEEERERKWLPPCMRIVFAAAKVWKTWISINNRYLFNWKKWCATIILHTSKVGKNLFSYISLFGFNSFKSIYPWRVTVCAYSVSFCTLALQNARFFRWFCEQHIVCVYAR